MTDLLNTPYCQVTLGQSLTMMLGLIILMFLGALIVGVFRVILNK